MNKRQKKKLARKCGCKLYGEINLPRLFKYVYRDAIKAMIYKDNPFMEMLKKPFNHGLSFPVGYFDVPRT